jgi:hypothetical protein
MSCCSGNTNKPSAGIDAITGKYERTGADNYEAYLDALKLNIIARKALSAASPTLHVSREGDRWRFETSIALKSWTSSFSLGTPFEEKTLDGREVESTVELVDESQKKFVIKQRAKKEGEHSTTIEREFKDNEMIETDRIDGMALVCTQRYKKLH